MNNTTAVIQLTEALHRLILEATHYHQTHRGEQFLLRAINDANAVLQVYTTFARKKNDEPE